MPVTLSLVEARRLAIASQGFGTRPSRPMAPDLRKLASRVHAFQIDSVNPAGPGPLRTRLRPLGTVPYRDA